MSPDESSPAGERSLAVEELAMYRQEVRWQSGRIVRATTITPEDLDRVPSVAAELARHPYLSRCLTSDADDDVWFRPMAEPSVPVIDTDDETTLGAFVNEMLAAETFPLEQPLIRFHRGRSYTGDGHLGLLVHHSLADGRAASALMGEVVARVSGEAPRDVGSFPSTPASRLIDPVEHAVERDEYVRRSADQTFRPNFRIPGDDSAPSRSNARLLTGDTNSFTRRLDTGPTRSTTAALLVCLGRAIAAEYGVASARITAGFTVDGRPLVGLPTDALGAYQLGGLVEVDTAADPIPEIERLAHDIRSQAQNRGILASLELQALALEQLTSTTESYVPLVVSNTGAIPRADHLDVWGCVPYHCFGSALYASVVSRPTTLDVTVVVPADTELDRRTGGILERLSADTGLVVLD